MMRAGPRPPNLEHTVIDPSTLRLLHRHQSDWSEMRPRHHDVADHDPERAWMRGAIYECECGDSYAILPEDESERRAHDPRG
jgi:hypothetical protein